MRKNGKEAEIHSKKEGKDVEEEGWMIDGRERMGRNLKMRLRKRSRWIHVLKWRNEKRAMERNELGKVRGKEGNIRSLEYTEEKEMEEGGRL